MSVLHRPGRKGMTLLELLAALVLASLLMTAIVGVLRNMHVKSDQIDSLGIPPAWHDRFAASFTWDVRNARRLRVGETSVTLTGYMSRDFATGQPTHRPTRVTYFVGTRNRSRWLFRREEHLDVASTENARTEVVCAGVGSIMLERLEEGAIRLSRRLVQARNQVFVTVPPRLRVSLFEGSFAEPTDTPIVSSEVFLR